MTVCEECGKEFSITGIGPHRRWAHGNTLLSCNRCGESVKRTLFGKHREGCKALFEKKDETRICPNCGKNLPLLSFGGHVGWCGKPKKRGAPWNKGLTKETDSRVRAYGETFRALSAAGAVLRPTSLSEEHKAKISQTTLKKSLEGTWHNSFSRARTYPYRGVKLYGTWELAYAKHLDSIGQEWERPASRFPYVFENRARSYTPDFYLPEEEVWVEVKGYPTEKDFAKWDSFPHELRILNGKDLLDLGIIQEYRKVERSYRGKSWAD